MVSKVVICDEPGLNMEATKSARDRFASIRVHELEAEYFGYDVFRAIAQLWKHVLSDPKWWDSTGYQNKGEWRDHKTFLRIISSSVDHPGKQPVSSFSNSDFTYLGQ